MGVHNNNNHHHVLLLRPHGPGPDHVVNPALDYYQHHGDSSLFHSQHSAEEEQQVSEPLPRTHLFL